MITTFDDLHRQKIYLETLSLYSVLPNFNRHLRESCEEPCKFNAAGFCGRTQPTVLGFHLFIVSSKWSMRRWRKSKKTLSLPAVLDLSVNRTGVTLGHAAGCEMTCWSQEKRVWERKRHTDGVIPLSPVKPFNVKLQHWNGPAASPHDKTTESEEERNKEAEKKQETQTFEAWTLTNKTFFRKSVGIPKTTHSCPDFTRWANTCTKFSVLTIGN